MSHDQADFDRQLEAARTITDRCHGVLSKLAESERLESGRQMNITVRKIGNSEGVILPKEMLEHLNVHAGDTLAVIQEQGELRLRRLEDDPEEFERKMKIARERMRKYEAAYRALAK